MGEETKGRDGLPPQAPQAKGAASVVLPLRPRPALSHSAGGGGLKLWPQAPPRPLSPGGNREVGGSPANTVSSRGANGCCLGDHEPRASGADSGPCSHGASIPPSISHTHPAPEAKLMCPTPPKVAPSLQKSPEEMPPNLPADSFSPPPENQHAQA